MAPGEMPEENVTEASPEEEEMLQQALDVGLQTIHGEGQQGDKIAQMVMAAPDIAQGIGQATATVVLAVEQVVPNMTEDVKMALSQEIVAELAEMSIKAGALAENELDTAMLEKIVSHAYSQYLTLKEAAGQLDPAKLQEDVDATRADMAAPAPSQAPAGGLFPLE